MGNLDRLATYVNWPADTSISCLTLASSGFVYTGVSDQVTCPLCGLVIKDWSTRNVNPLNEHRLRSPYCSFFSDDQEELNRRLDSPSTSLNGGSSSTEQSNIMAVYRSATERAQRHGVIDGQVPPVGRGTATSRDSEAGARRETIDRANPDYRLLRHEATRLSTFEDWPLSGVVQPPDLARAGFFYTGEVDRTRCAFCRRVLRRWRSGDVPDREHQRHFPDCPFVLRQDVGNVPLHPDNSPVRQMAALNVMGDFAHSTSTSDEPGSSTASAAAATSTIPPPADVTATNRTAPQHENNLQGQLSDSSDRQPVTGDFARQQATETTENTTRIANRLGKYPAVCYTS